MTRPVPMLTLVVLAAGCGGPGGRAIRTAGPPPTGIVTSNILRDDYAGSASCAGCHSTIHRAWQRSPMHRMTRDPEQAEIRAPFGSGRFQFKDDLATFQRHGDQRFMQVRSPSFGDHLYRVTRVIGGRHREDFAGLEVTGTSPGAPVIGDPTRELVLPVSFVFSTQSFRLKGYSVMVGERPGLRAGGVWNQTCIACHNTLPQFENYWSAAHGPGAPAHQSVLVDRLLPADRRLAVSITDPGRVVQAVQQEIRFLGGRVPEDADARELLALAARTNRANLQARHLVEIGVGCEACHGGSREHVEHADRRPSFEPRSDFLSIQRASGSQPTRAEWINRTCARCHQVLFTRYAYTWEGGLRQVTPGGSHINSGEGRDFLLGGCARQMSCSTCHDAHGGSAPAALAALATPAGNGTCTGCHAKLAGETAVRAHAHHDPAGAGGSCVACHMPRKNLGLDYQLTRYHRIGSPSDRLRVESDRPLECALCHPGDGVGKLVDAIERWWGKRYDRNALIRLYGDLRTPVLEATVKRGLPHEQATALAVLGEQLSRWRRRAVPAVAGAREARDPLRVPDTMKSAEPLIAGQLAHEYPLVRYFARNALERLGGERLSLDVERPMSEIRAAVLRRWPRAPLPPVGAASKVSRDSGDAED
jgi:predicted CXXCH cytochrome family protein